MKKLFAACCLLAMISSCQKNSSNPTPPAPLAPQLIAADFYFTGLQGRDFSRDSLAYDANRRLVTYIERHYDSIPPSKLLDSMVYVFSFNGNNPYPNAYTTTHYDIWGHNYQQQHSLIYDNQNRVVFDTIALTSATVNLAQSNHFRYAPSYIIVNQYQQRDALDTIFLNNGNISQFSVYAATNPNTPNVLSLDFIDYFTPSGTANPAYNKDAASTIGPALYLDLGLDVISQYLPLTNKSIPFKQDVTYTWIKDASGKVVEGTGKDIASGQVIEKVYFRYR